MLERARGAEVLLTNKVVLDREKLAALPRLRLMHERAKLVVRG